MKAAVIEKKGELVVREVPEPVIDDYECLCDVLYGATCSGTDLHIINNKMPFPINYPTVLGHESIGRVTEIGPKVENFKPGNLVTRVINKPSEGIGANWGGFAQQGIITDHEAMKKIGIEAGFSYGVHRVLPDSFDPAGSTMIITWRETLSFISRIGVKEGSRVLIVGSGANGLSFANHSANMQASAVVMTGSPAREKDAVKVGVTNYIHYNRDDIVILMRTQGLDKFDLIIDSVGKKDQLDKVLPLLNAGGIIALYGIDDHGQVTLNPAKAAGTFTYANYGYNEGEAHNTVIEQMKKGLLQAENYCDMKHIFMLEHINQAFEFVKKREMIKAIIKIK